MAQEAAELRQRVAILPRPHQGRPDRESMFVQMPLFRVTPDSHQGISRPTLALCKQWLHTGRIKVGQHTYTGEFVADVGLSDQYVLWREVSAMLVEQEAHGESLLQVIRIPLEGGLELYQAFERKRKRGQQRLFGLRFFVKDPFEEAQSPCLVRIEGYTIDIRPPARIGISRRNDKHSPSTLSLRI